MVGRPVRPLIMRTESTPRVHRGVFRGALGPRGVDSAVVLREQWSAQSLCSVWPATAAEWHCAAVDAVCEGLADSGVARPDARAAARELGAQRVEIGVALDEARADLAVAAELARLDEVARLRLVDALTIGWVEQAVERLGALPLREVRTEMATAGYLRMRLHELYREAVCLGADVSTHFLLVAAETDRTADRLVAETRLTTLYSSMEYAFVGGESIVATTPRRVVALAARDELRLADSLARLRSELKMALAEGRLPSVRCWRQPLPPDAASLSLTMLGLLD